MRILVCGGRDFVDRYRIQLVLGQYRDQKPTIVHGDARGADSIAAALAFDMGYPTDPYPVKWHKNGYYNSSAAFERNIEMLESGVDLVIAFTGAGGTAHTVREAQKRGIRVRDER